MDDNNTIGVDPLMVSCDVRFKDGKLSAEDIKADVVVPDPNEPPPLSMPSMDTIVPVIKTETNSPVFQASNGGGRGGGGGGGSRNGSRSQSPTFWAEGPDAGFGGGKRSGRHPNHTNTRVQCYSCQSFGHYSRDCPNPSANPRDNMGSGGGGGRGHGGGNRYGANRQNQGQRQPRQYTDPWAADQSECLPNATAGDAVPITRAISNAVLKEPVIDHFPQLPEYYLNESLSDIAFVIDGQTLFAHKFVLAAKCEVFERLLYGTQPMDTSVVSDDNEGKAVNNQLSKIDDISIDENEDKPADESEDKTADESEDNMIDKSADKVIDENANINMTEAEDKAIDNEDKTVDELADKGVDEIVDKAVDQLKSETVEETAEQIVDKVMEEIEHKAKAVVDSDVQSMFTIVGEVDDKTRVELSDTTVDAFKQFLRFFYFSALDLNLSNESVKCLPLIRNLLKLTISLKMWRMTEMIENELIHRLNVKTLVDVCQLVVDFDLKLLSESLTHFIRNNAHHIVTHKVFASYSEQMMLKMFKAVHSPYLAIKGLKQLMDAKPDVDLKAFRDCIDLKKLTTIEEFDTIDGLKLFDRSELYVPLRQYIRKTFKQ